MALPFLGALAAIPGIGWAAAGVVAVGAAVVGLAYAFGDDDKKPNKPKKIIFLTGETGVGKDTIWHILKGGKFENHDATSKLEKDEFEIFENRICLINTAGARDNDDENLRARRDLQIGAIYIYVFRANDYFADDNIKKQIVLDLEAHKEMCQRESFELKIIGTHRDKCPKDIGEAQIQKLINEIGDKGKYKCQVFDLTQFNGKTKQRELYDFITTSNDLTIS